METRTVGQNAKHLKLKLKQDEQIFDTIYFGGGEFYSKLPLGIKIDVAYQIDENIWNGRKCLQLKVKDIKKD
ncbi:MAG: Single-stranded-DNA-specific exonuclease RecJ [Candidatus Woesebacteria bacterium GW2011_GWB1_41_10]|uniref:Single-stranded-DNA-specific exonuclease RecJ n=1 Tax=Candidatus Woesebacteria bacterium GW2011_GWB1_41_10 TaxID=1618577 RepID=A0A0G0X996_9BACT|nr:MAG: Single-stranded-DNA-specific exonuclease RecJ [Candidatus Woesebacteria bacterium GW2011_GWB1_41_10]